MVPELVRRAMLVHEPYDLPLVLSEIGGELQRDRHVDLQPVRFADVERTPDRHLMRKLPRREPLSGDRDHFGLVAGGAQRAHQTLGVRFGAAADERRLRVQYGETHPRSSSRRNRATSTSSCCTLSARAVESSAWSASSRSYRQE